nr:immunoglobulin heavy chain junction region [Mus musculus]
CAKHGLRGFAYW